MREAGGIGGIGRIGGTASFTDARLNYPSGRQAMVTVAQPADRERRGLLLAAKLRALVKRSWSDVDVPEPAAAASGVAVQVGRRGWVLPDDSECVRGFALALLWGLHRHVAELHVLLDANSDLTAVARQAACFRTSVAVWAVTGGTLTPAEAPPLPPEPPLNPLAEPFRDIITAAGAEAVEEWGVLTGEVLGLQVARVRSSDDSGWIEVGIGKHDRLANQLAWGNQPSTEALVRVVAPALEARRSGDLNHPLNQLGRERWLRHHLRRRPDLVELAALTPIAPPRPLGDLRVPLLAPGLGYGADGRPVLVACSVGFDPTFLPMAAELHAGRVTPDTPLVVVLPQRDVHPLTRTAVADLRVPAEVRTVPDDWYIGAADSGPQRNA